MYDFVNEPPRQTPVQQHCITAVVGGGFAGIAAALSAARAGSDVILFEQQYALGGLATLGLITHYLPLCDGYGRQVSFGIAAELMRLSVSLDEKADVIKEWHSSLQHSRQKTARRLICEFNPSLFAILAERLLLSAGVRIFYGTSICGVEIRGGTVSALLVESREGRWAVSVRNVVDCSGDAAVCRQAGASTALFAQQNILAAWYAATQNGVLQVIPLGACDIPDKYKATMPQMEEQNAQKRYAGVTAEDLSAFSIDAHEMLLEDYLKKGQPTSQHRLAAIPAIPEVRMTRKIIGIQVLEENEGVVFDDSIGMISDWKRPGPIYEIPFSCLCTPQVHNILAAGRCISVSDTMWDLTRVIPACAVTGEAAGLAAAMYSDFRRIRIPEIQSVLRARGVALHADELAFASADSP